MEVKGYLTSEGYMGFIDGEYQLFDTEKEYIDIIFEKEMEEEDGRDKR